MDVVILGVPRSCVANNAGHASVFFIIPLLLPLLGFFLFDEPSSRGSLVGSSNSMGIVALECWLI
jgi:hypothetical protein